MPGASHPLGVAALVMDYGGSEEEHLEKLPDASDSTHLVYLADKIHNLRALVIEYNNHGEDLWESFNGGKDGTLWYYKRLIEIFEASKTPRLIMQDLKQVYGDLECLIKEKAG